MALTPSKNMTEAEKRAQRDVSEQNVLLREVDEAVRQDQLADFAQRYGRKLIAVIVISLAMFAGWLWWRSHQESQLEQTSEKIVKATDQLDAGNLTTADQAFAQVESGTSIGAQTVAKLTRAGIAFREGKRDGALKLYADVANDGSAPKPYRDFATLREVSINYEKMKPADIVTRLKPLAVPGSPFFGSAGELLGAAYLDQGRRDLAGPLFAEIAKDKNVPESLRSRSRQLAGLMGVDAIQDVDKTLGELRAAGAQGAN